MSTDYSTKEKISFADLFDGRLERYGVREHISEDSTEKRRCLTDGRNYLWVFAADDRTLEILKRYGGRGAAMSDFPGGGNAPGQILGAIAEAFDTDIFSEYEPQFWSFDTQEEWDRAWKKISGEHEAKFHADIINYVAGEPNDLRPGSIGMIKANIAKDLVADSPDLVSPDKKTELMEAIDQVYEGDHAVTIKLDEEEIAEAQMAMAHEDDLPQA